LGDLRHTRSRKAGRCRLGSASSDCALSQRPFLALLAALATLVVVTPAPAHAAAPSYVALGDSYSSGTGTRSYLADGTMCQRSSHAFPKLLASQKGYALTFGPASAPRSGR
jgi:hypothetical protein